MLVEKSFKDLIDELASGDPTPGGGSAAAMAGATATALILMVMGITMKKITNTDDMSSTDRRKLSESWNKLQEIKKYLIDLVDKDASAYKAVMKSFKLPKGTESQKETRRIMIQEDYKTAAMVPYYIISYVNMLGKIIEDCKDLFPKNMSSDVGVAKLLADSVFDSAILNMEINLKEIKDERFKEVLKKMISDSRNRRQGF